MRLLLAATAALALAIPASAVTFTVTPRNGPAKAVTASVFSKAGSPLRPVAANLPATLGAPIAASMSGGGNLVDNGSFETGDFSGWTQAGDTSFTFVTSTPAAGGPTDGVYHAAFGPIDDFGGIYQFLATEAATNYHISWDLAYLGGLPNAFAFLWDDDLYILDFDFPGFDYISIAGVLPSSSAGTFIDFYFYTPPSFWLLDNVSVSAVIPEPATWALLIAGFGLVGAAARRRRPATA